MFQGAGEAINLVPMNGKLNGSGGEWYKLEQVWKNSLHKNKSVQVHIEPLYSGTGKRPESFNISYYIDKELFELPPMKNTQTGK